MKQKNTPIERAIEVAGSVDELAAMVGRQRRQVFNVKKSGVVPLDWCPLIHAGTGIPLHELRPDAFAKPSRRS